MRASDEGKTKPVKMPKIPESVGGAIDLLDRTRDERRMIEAQAKAVRDVETAIEEAIFAKFKKAELEGARGKLAQASIKSTDVPTFEEWDVFAAHLKKHPEDLDLLQRRLSMEAVRARWAEKKTVPGVGSFTKIALSLTKVKASGRVTAPKRGSK